MTECEINKKTVFFSLTILPFHYWLYFLGIIKICSLDIFWVKAREQWDKIKGILSLIKTYAFVFEKVLQGRNWEKCSKVCKQGIDPKQCNLIQYRLLYLSIAWQLYCPRTLLLRDSHCKMGNPRPHVQLESRAQHRCTAALRGRGLVFGLVQSRLHF